MRKWMTNWLIHRVRGWVRGWVCYRNLQWWQTLYSVEEWREVCVCVCVCVWKAPPEVCIDHWITREHWGCSVTPRPTSRKRPLYSTCARTHIYTSKCSAPHTWIHLTYPCNAAHTHTQNEYKQSSNPLSHTHTLTHTHSHTHTHTHHIRILFLLPAQCGTGHRLGPPQMLLNLEVDGLSSLLIKWLICDVEAWALRCYFCSLQLTPP